MKLTVLNIIRRHGIGKNSGKDYDFTTIQYMEPVESVDTETFHQTGYGYDVAEIPATLDVHNSLAGHKFPGIIDFETDSRKTPRGFELVVVGVK